VELFARHAIAGRFFFWNDILIGHLKTEYPELHRICEEPNATVAEYWTEDDWDVNFSGSLSSSDYNSWVDFMAAVHYHISIQTF